MPEFIPNQPITFGATDQACLNNDQRAYAMLMQGEEEWKLQIENTSCDGAEGSVCDVDMNDLGAYLVDSEFTSATEWTAQDAIVVPNNGYAVLFVDSGASNEGLLEKTITPPTACGVLEYKTVKLTFEIVNAIIAGSCDFYVKSTDGATFLNLYSGFPFTGINEMYVKFPIYHSSIQIGLTGTDGDLVRMTSIRIQEVAECWTSGGE